MRALSVMVCLSLAALLGSCSDDGGESPDAGGQNAKTRYVGTWRYTAGSITTVCGGSPQTGDIAGGTRTIALGTSSDLTITWGECTYKLNMSGTSAVAAAGQTCTALEESLSAWTLSTADGLTMSDSGSSVAAAGSTSSCTSTEWSGTLTKVQ